ncbi:E3 ubiquitin-protein ligase RNF213 [Stylophora pistillata]|uniref:E3 ubiquitin-protein ligase RNF213 n=1 Tax=Stylophora pistillata TaxID=50429 RepID=A0A2B4RRN7_STYPI|nr:E3 ubiquitin-protein ligase RNF213 [Stylophora pistillata]
MSKRPFYDLLPTIECQTPRTVLCRFADTPDKKDFNPLFDVKEFRNAPFQRVYQYLKLSNEGKSLDNFTFSPGDVDDDQRTCLVLLLRNCGIPDPSWSEIRHFVSFLNSQLRDCEHSFYCDMKLMRTVLEGPHVLNLEGFRSFVVRFMIQMSRDFATPSLTEENTVFYTEDNAELERKEIEQFQLRRRWESSPHPYLFFNQDHVTMTFLGFFINCAGDLVDPQTRRTLEKGLMSKTLRIGLQAQRVDFATNMETSKKEDKINQLCSVMGVNWSYDPDRAYELTTDNVKKILAIHMRFRCVGGGIVKLVAGYRDVGEGSDGGGASRDSILLQMLVVRFFGGSRAACFGRDSGLVVTMRRVEGTIAPLLPVAGMVHGGTTYEDIKLKVHQAEKMARANQDRNIDTVLFFDEANTTEALTMIKEVMVDRRINGRPIGQGLERLQFIAACNPYRRHTDDMIHKLESAGLGYHVKADESEDRLGHIPLRHLVYRVHALPGSMRPLIWDFGQLKPDVERLYTNQIVSRFDECSFVSLRDVERAMQVMVWFYKHADTLGRLMKKVIAEQRREEGLDVDGSDDEDEVEPITPLTRALVLAIGVCYHAKLQERREEYRTVVASSFEAPCLLPGGHKQILREISSCQKAVLNELELGPNIARNTALSENVFLMVVCIELRIPLFVVGKPGSSKSLAKTVVAHNMQGDAAKSELFKTFKQVHMASYQCSPLSTPEGILATFRQCSKLQEGKNSDKFVSVVVLDEVGLAEDSPLMPLKTLHPLLEDGVTSADDVIETDEKPQRVAFIGISNWALDPAKMNRGIMLSRGVPSKEELIDSALGICSTDKMVKALIQPLISPLAAGYAALYKEQKSFVTLKECGKEEFFGLRDFYSLIKMVYSVAAKSKKRPLWQELEHAIKRNFGGLVEGDPVGIFKRYYTEKDVHDKGETSTTIRLIEASLGREDVADRANFSENRYLLILTENYAALPIMQQHFLKTAVDAVVIFGSSFPNDQEYTQICRNINRIKVCMETGRTVILLNLESLYESLYDALNQYYERFGGEKYVDLGLGTHRVKCRVHDGFKLIVIAEKDVVYNSFPIPLINRLEKHFLVTLTSLSPKQKKLVQKLRTWASEFAKVTSEGRRSRVFSIGDAFVGFHEDTIPSIVMQVCYEIERDNYAPTDDDAKNAWEDEVEYPEMVRERSETMLLQMATPDAIARLPHTALGGMARDVWNAYFNEQQHSSLAAFMSLMLLSDDIRLDKKHQEGLLVQITTHSRLLSNIDLEDICIQTKFHRSTVDFLTLQQFQTEQQFRASVRAFFEQLGGECPGILLVQCDSGDENFNLIAGARHILLEERTNASEMLNLCSVEAVHIVLIIQLPRIAGGCRNFVGFQGGKWMSLHIDELRPPGKHTPSIEQLIDRPISKLFSGVHIEEDDLMQAATVAVKLLRNCVQAAACRVESETESAERSTHRIELLLDLLPDNFQSQKGEESFASVVVQRTYHLLEESELIASNPQGWLQSEALLGTGVQEWGTFRKALLQRVFSVVVPILAEIIAFADRDCNLDLVKNDDTWVSRLWLKILADRTISKLSYSDMISPGTNSVRERVQVIGSGAGGHRFSCRFPFSFIIKQRVEKLLKEASSVEAHSSSTTLLDSLREVIVNSQLGPPLDELRHSNSAGLLYLKDFVHMVYKHSSDVEHELLDVITLRICLEALEPSREMLLSPDTRRTWCDRVLSIRPAVEDMIRKERFGPVTEKCSNYGGRSAVMLEYCRTNEETASELRRRCNAFFMELVSIFCFGDTVSKDLEQEAISHLMQYVIGHQSTQTKDFSPFADYAIDPTPVVRSFLLQQLLRSSAKLTKLVKEHLGAFLQGAQNLKPEPSHVKEVCFLCVQCMEDILRSRYQAKVADSTLIFKLRHAKRTCEESFKALSDGDENSAEMSAQSLDGVAKGRYVLSLVVEYLYKLFIEGDSSYKDAKIELKSLFNSARKLCMEVSSSTPQLYLLKQLVRRYGLDCVRTLGEFEELAWILPTEARQQDEDVFQDRFIVHGNQYRAVREGLAKTVVSGNIQDFVTAITVRVKLDDFVRNGEYLNETARPFAKELLENKQGGNLKELQIYNGKSPQEHALAEIVIHTVVALQCTGAESLAQPLYSLMTDPSIMKNSFLPTMPEDNYIECINAIAETMKGTQWVGEWKDRTKTGHALGEPGSRPTNAEPQRDMPPIVCGLLRIIMHSAMVMGASKYPQVTAQLIIPSCPSQSVESVGQFLWQHLQRDLDALSRALGCSVDDAALTVHLALQRMISLNGGKTGNVHDMHLQTRESRRSWEKAFCSQILVPVFTHHDESLKNASRLLMGDERFGKDPLVRQLYEFDEQVEDLSLGIRPMSRALWKYRQHITVEELSSSFQREVLSGGEEEFKLLDAFLKQEHKLRFVHFLPDVVRLHRLLMDRFHLRIDRTNAENYTVREFLKELPKGSVKDEYTNLFQSFKNAWNACKSFLGDQGRLRVPQDLCNTTMDNDCPIAMVLPSTSGMGICSTSLTFFLVNVNNESLGAYRSATNQDSFLERVSVSEVTLSHLVAYDPQRDLLPLILAHCNYSLEVGQETLVHYDWAALERQLIDRLFRGRPFVEFKEERFAFSQDTRDDAVFASLSEKIPQESITRVIESQIIVDLRSSLSDVCDVMSSLDIAIGFLASSGGQPQRPLKWYLHEVLKLRKERGLKSPTEPFEQLPDVFKEKLSTSEQASLNRVLRKIDMDIFLPQLLQIILLNVKKDGETISTMSFEEYLDLCLANKGLEQIPGTENIPEGIKMVHLKAVWNSAVQLSDDFHKDRQAV